jgi:hypothetical protein
MSRIIALIAVTTCCFFLADCGHDPSRKQSEATDSLAADNGAAENRPAINVGTHDNITTISFDRATFDVPSQLNITKENIFDGIYELRSDSLFRRKSLTINNLAFVTTFEDLGRGIRSNLFVFDLVQKTLIKDSSFKRAYLHSSAGIFVIDSVSAKIFVIGKSEWYNKKNELMTAGSIYEIKNGYFYFEKNVYKDGELEGDSVTRASIISFYKSAVSGKGVHPLPDNWWENR